MTIKLDIGHCAVPNGGADLEFIPAQRVVVLCQTIARVGFAAIARSPVVIEDDFLVKFFEHAADASTKRREETSKTRQGGVTVGCERKAASKSRTASSEAA